MSDICPFPFIIVGTQKTQRSDSIGRGGVQSFFGSMRRAVSREELCVDSPSITPLKIFRPTRVVLKRSCSHNNPKVRQR